MTDSTDRVVDRDRDVLVTSFDATIKVARGRRMRATPGTPWNVYLGADLIERFEHREKAIRLARMVSAKSGRPAWLSIDGIAFEPIDQM